MPKTLEEKRAEAIAYLGSKYVLHAEYSKGTVNHCPENTDVERTIKRVRKQQAEAAKREAESFAKIINVRQINGGRK